MRKIKENEPIPEYGDMGGLMTHAVVFYEDGTEVRLSPEHLLSARCEPLKDDIDRVSIHAQSMSESEAVEYYKKSISMLDLESVLQELNLDKDELLEIVDECREVLFYRRDNPGSVRTANCFINGTVTESPNPDCPLLIQGGWIENSNMEFIHIYYALEDDVEKLYVNGAEINIEQLIEDDVDEVVDNLVDIDVVLIDAKLDRVELDKVIAESKEILTALKDNPGRVMIPLWAANDTGCHIARSGDISHIDGWINNADSEAVSICYTLSDAGDETLKVAGLSVNLDESNDGGSKSLILDFGLTTHRFHDIIAQCKASLMHLRSNPINSKPPACFDNGYGCIIEDSDTQKLARISGWTLTPKSVKIDYILYHDDTEKLYINGKRISI